MSHKVHPIGYRLGVNASWSGRWFDEKNYSEKLKDDIAIRAHLNKKLRSAGLDKIEIERTTDRITIIVNTSRPGLIIGRLGAGAEGLKDELESVVKKVHAKYRNKNKLPEVKVDIREVRNPDSFANIIGLSIAEQLERRMPFRRVMKRSMDRILVNKEVKGAKIMLSGRLGGAEMSRREWLGEGRMPRNTLRSNIDMVAIESYTSYGVIGIKVWVYKGEKLE